MIQYMEKEGGYIKVAVAAVIIMISAPIIANAATNGEFFNRIWGRLTRENIKSHEETLFNEQDLPYKYTFPAREYVDVDPDKAEALIGNYVNRQHTVQKMGDTTLTILTTVQDGNAAVMEFTLERKGGVNAFEYSQLDNEFQGAQFSGEADFWFEFPNCIQNIIVDLKQSTEEKLYCYDYMVVVPEAFDKEKRGMEMEISEYPCTKRELFEADAETFEKYKKETKITKLIVPFCEPMQTVKFANAAGGIAQISPMSVTVDSDIGLGLERNNQELNDTESIYYLSINYKNGTSYMVQEHEMERIHSCETRVDNTFHSSYGNKGEYVFVFNRLVDTEEIDSITVNQTTYKRI